MKRIPGMVWVIVMLSILFVLLVLRLDRFDPHEWIVGIGSNLLLLVLSVLIFQLFWTENEKKHKRRNALNILYRSFQDICLAVGTAASASSDPESGVSPRRVRKRWTRAATHLSQNLVYVAGDLEPDIRNSLRVIKDLLNEVISEMKKGQIDGVCVAQDARMIVETMRQVTEKLGGARSAILFEGAEEDLKRLELRTPAI